MFPNTFHKAEWKEIIPSPFHEARITLIAKLGNNRTTTTKKERKK
jgi:hypothetical protein